MFRIAYFAHVSYCLVCSCFSLSDSDQRSFTLLCVFIVFRNAGTQGKIMWGRKRAFDITETRAIPTRAIPTRAIPTETSPPEQSPPEPSLPEPRASRELVVCGRETHVWEPASFPRDPKCMGQKRTFRNPLLSRGLPRWQWLRTADTLTSFLRQPAWNWR